MIRAIIDQILDLVPNEQDRSMLLHNIHWFRFDGRRHGHFMALLQFMSILDGHIPEDLRCALDTFPIDRRHDFVDAFRDIMGQLLWQNVPARIRSIADQVLNLVPKEEDQDILLDIVDHFRDTEHKHPHFMTTLQTILGGDIPEGLKNDLDTFPINRRLDFVDGFRYMVVGSNSSATEYYDAYDMRRRGIGSMSDPSGSGGSGGDVRADDQRAAP